MIVVSAPVRVRRYAALGERALGIKQSTLT